MTASLKMDRSVFLKAKLIKGNKTLWTRFDRPSSYLFRDMVEISELPHISPHNHDVKQTIATVYLYDRKPSTEESTQTLQMLAAQKNVLVRYNAIASRGLACWVYCWCNAKNFATLTCVSPFSLDQRNLTLTLLTNDNRITHGAPWNFGTYPRCRLVVIKTRFAIKHPETVTALERLIWSRNSRNEGTMNKQSHINDRSCDCMPYGMHNTSNVSWKRLKVTLEHQNDDYGDFKVPGWTKKHKWSAETPTPWYPGRTPTKTNQLELLATNWSSLLAYPLKGGNIFKSKSCSFNPASLLSFLARRVSSPPARIRRLYHLFSSSATDFFTTNARAMHRSSVSSIRMSNFNLFTFLRSSTGTSLLPLLVGVWEY